MMIRRIIPKSMLMLQQQQKRTIFMSSQSLLQKKDWTDRVGDKMEDMKDKAENVADRMGDKMKNMADKAANKMDSAFNNNTTTAGTTTRTTGTPSSSSSTFDKNTKFAEDWIREEESSYSLFHDHAAADAVGNADGPIGRDPAEKSFEKVVKKTATGTTTTTTATGASSTNAGSFKRK